MREHPTEELITVLKKRRYFSAAEIGALDVNNVEEERRQALRRYDERIRTWKACEEYKY